MYLRFGEDGGDDKVVSAHDSSSLSDEYTTFFALIFL